MSEKIAVECDCGYTVYASETEIGSTIECMNCHAELEVTPPAPAPVEPAVAAASEIPAAPDTPTQEAPRAPTAPSSAPKSPFEDDEESEASPFAEESAASESIPADSAAPSLSQSPPAQNPFQDDEPGDEEQAPSGPFTLEAAPESKDASFSDLMEAERPKDSLRNDRVETESPLDKKTGETCTECGRDIRGEWDRFALEEGVLCYICSNQATHGVPLRMQTGKGQRELTDDDYLLERKPPPEPEPAPWYLDAQSDIFKRVVLVLAFGTIGIALFVNFFDVGTPSPEALQQARLAATEAAQSEPEIVLPLWANIIIWSWRAFGAYLGLLITLYFVLDRDGSLPRDTVKTNVLHICLVLSIVAGIQVFSSLAYFYLMPIFVAGGFFYVLVWAFSVFAQIMVVNGMLDLRLRDWMWAILFYFPLTQILLQSIGLFLYAGIYQLVS